MVTDDSWRLGKSDSNLYRLFDRVRKRVNTRLVSFLASCLDDSSGKKILEAGSGPAFGSFYFSKQPGVQLSVALDHDIEALKDVRKQNPNLDVVVADIYQMPFKTNTFDLVWNSSTFEHLEKSNAALNEMKRVTRERGYVFCGVPFRFGPFFFQPFINRTNWGEWIGPVFSKKEIKSLFDQAGLQFIKNNLYFFGCFMGILAKKQ